MTNTGEDALRLAACKAILELIDRRRADERDEGIGVSIERQILSRELAELEEEACVPASAIHSCR